MNAASCLRRSCLQQRERFCQTIYVGSFLGYPRARYRSRVPLGARHLNARSPKRQPQCDEQRATDYARVLLARRYRA